MRLRSFEFQGLTRFAEPVKLDLEALGPGLVALVGRNGEGKTTALEAPLVALYREMPSYPGTVYGQIPGKTAWVRADFMDGARQEVTAEVRLNAKARTGECFLTVDGTPVTTGKARDYDEQIERRFGSMALVLASVFASQNKAGNFLSMSRADRRELFAELLGLGRYVELSAAAREKAAESATAATAARAALGALDFSPEEYDHVLARLDGIADVDAIAESAVEQSRTDMTAAELALATLDDQVRARASASERREAAWRQAMARRSDLEMAQESAARARAAVEEEIASLAVRSTVRDEIRELAGRDLEQLQAEREQLREGLALAELGDRRLAELLRELERRDAAVAAVVAKFDRQRAAIEARIETFRQMTAPLDQAPCITGLAGFAEERGTWLVPFSDEPHDLAGTCPLLAGGREALGKIEQLAAEVEAIAPALERERLAADDPTERAQLVAERDVLQDPDAASVREMIRESAPQAIRDVDGTIARVQAARSEVAAVGGIVAAKVVAEARLPRVIEEGDQQIAAARARVEEAQEAHRAADAEYESIADPGDATSARRRVQLSREAVALHERELSDLRAERATLTERRAAMERARGEAERQRALLEDAERDKREWLLLDQGFGAKGIQALEIDAAGPTVSALANDLLAVCPAFSRFSLRFDTLRTKQDGTQAEDFDVHVFVDGEERPVDKFSGGQKVIIGEAIGLALAIFNAQRFGVRWQTLFRDETAGALDHENAQAYVAMLRRAMQVGGFVNVLFVSHVPEVWEAADVAVQIEGGAIRS